MKLKPSKCTSLSLKRGKPEDVPFFIGDNRISSIRDKEQKFLGKLLFFKGKPDETFNMFKDTLTEGIENIDKALVRNEYKLWIYSNYFLPSKRFLLTVHTLTQTQLKQLDTLTDKAIKRWAGVPRSATNVIIHIKEGLDIKSITQLYTETHTVSHIRTRLHGDTSVNNAINCTVARESSWSTKQSTTVNCESTFLQALHLNSVNGEVPEFTGNQATKLQRKFNDNVKINEKEHIDMKHRDQCMEKLKSLAVQRKSRCRYRLDMEKFHLQMFTKCSH